MLINTLVILIALLHLWFLLLEMFLWQKPMGMKVFKTNPTFAAQSAQLAANQGLYNGFLSAGLLWSVLAQNPQEAWHLKIFFLSCVIIAGVYGAITVNMRILVVQALPAIVTLGLVLIM